MATYKQVNKSTNIVSVGRTAPVPRGRRTSNESLPVVLASDAPAIPVVEQNKVQSEVALSLLGIPRAEVALGIFADVNTYDVNPSEWSIDPIDKRRFVGAEAATGIRPFIYEGSSYSSNEYNWGLTHVPEEAGAMIEAPPGESATLTSKRFFRYQPGRVSSATFGVKSSGSATKTVSKTNRNPSIKKYGIYDKFDGYYWETRAEGRGDQFGVTRRTQSIIDFRFHHKEFTVNTAITNAQTTDYGIVGKGKEATEIREAIMNSPIAYSNGSQIIIPAAYGDLRKHFKSSTDIPQVGMMIQDITVSSSSSPDQYGRANMLTCQDSSPLFRESTVITAVEQDTSNNDMKISLNQPPIRDSIWSIGIGLAGNGAVNPANASSDSLSDTANGRNESPFGYNAATGVIGNGKRRRRLKFTFAGENLLIRDNLPLIHAGIYDPSMLKDRVEYEISSATNGPGTVTFLRPESAADYLSNADDLQNKGARKFDDSPKGLYVQNVFSVGQLVEYTTDATSYTDSAGNSFLGTGVNNVFFISEVDAGDNSIKLSNIATRASNNSPLAAVFTNNSAVSSFSGTKHYIKTPVPFMFPEVEYTDTANNFNVSDTMFPYSRNFTVFDPTKTAGQTATTGTSHRGAKEQFGLIDTNLADAAGDLDSTKLEQLKADINDINSGLTCAAMGGGRHYNSATDASNDKDPGGHVVDKRFHRKASGWRYWIEQNINPEYWGVYEYKVPRSRFSFDSLNGGADESIFYGDVVTDQGKRRYPGQLTAEEVKSRTSLWDIDFGNVIMKKIEFSWYGAVGALFLAYVPVGSGEARWVRVHHLRCSNQLKTASLGNATLPLTYTVFGGGMPKQYGDPSLRTTNYSSGKSASEFITKYGSSYYIDGGDRGTVRLFNYAQPAASKISTSKFDDEVMYEADTGTTNSVFRIKAEPSKTGREDMYFGATVKFGSGSASAIVNHVERKDTVRTDSNSNDFSPSGLITITLDRSMVLNSPVNFFIDAPYTVFGLEAKRNIQSSQDFLVRNRVQVYPTKLSVGMQTPGGGQKTTTSLSLRKNVIFQDDVVFKIYADDNDRKFKNVKFDGTDTQRNLKGSGLPTRLTSENNAPLRRNSGAGLSGGNQTTGGPHYTGATIGDKLYGWARVTDGVTPFTLFGRLEVADIGPRDDSPIWDFIPSDSYSGTVRFVQGSYFTHAYQYYNDLGANNMGPGTDRGRLTSAITTFDQEIERLSSVNVSNEIRRPIPGTGNKVASFFLEDGSEYFDLQPYFDYNKDYISFPLTNIPDNVFIGATINANLSPSSSGLGGGSGESDSPRISASLTWEEQ